MNGINPESGNEINALVDTGSARSLVNANKIKNINFDSYFPPLFSVDGKRPNVIGTKILNVFIDHYVTKFEFIIITDMLFEAIIGINFLSGNKIIITFHLRETAINNIEMMLKHDIIRPSTSAWRAPVTMPEKKDGSRYPLPNIRELIERLCGSRYFTTLDISNAPVYSINEFNFIPFGITSAPAAFQ
ncbi:hypothetical protein RF11_08605 [Thelohanellus kitauei]|uniref:Peptidase A2 domain-containing protein n=1 Tax=Thelohanellus kitauei TaxID=669202 RepID=A0A0C2IGZ5_THEKT|nr:hypothetical protein RF11_08605 [Thelohanellus kitauei]